MDSGSKLHAVPWMIRVLGSCLWMVAALAGLEMVIAGGGVYTAWVMRGLVNAAVGGASYALRLSVVVFAAVSAALIALRALYRFLRERARTMFQNILRLRFLGKVLHAELSSVQAVHTGECDLSFIGLAQLADVFANLCEEGSIFLGLIKPQFESQHEETDHGIVRSEAVRQRVVDEVTQALREVGFRVNGVVESSIKGAEGNVEYLVHATFLGSEA